MRNSIPASRSAQAKCGFTILQLAILLALITLAACLGITMFFAQPNVTLNNAMELLRDDIITAKNRALITHSRVTVHFYPDGNGYEARYETGDFLPSPTGRGDFIREYDFDGVFEGVTFSEVDFGSDRSLTLDTSGLTTEDGSVTLSFEGETAVIEITRAGGVDYRDKAKSAKH